MAARLRKLWLASVLAVGTATVWSSPALGYHFGQWCNGNPVKWDGYLQMARDQCSMPNGTDPDWAYWNGGWQWYRVCGKMDWNWYYNDGCHITLGNGRNETARVPRASIGGVSGFTLCLYTSCNPSSTYFECDVKLADDLWFGNEDESFWHYSDYDQGRVSLLHEFGHVLGLDHTAAFDIMRTRSPLPINGGPADHAEPFPDDAAGAIYMYGHQDTTNVFVSAQKLSSNQILPTNTDGWNNTTVNLCRGNSFSLTYTVANNSVTTVSSGFHIFMNTDMSYTNGTLLFDGTANSPALTYFTETRTLYVPTSLPNGVYFILWQIDAHGQTSEWNEGDNSVHSAMTINVQC